jgi:hypothetical protein
MHLTVFQAAVRHDGRQISSYRVRSSMVSDTSALKEETGSGHWLRLLLADAPDGFRAAVRHGGRHFSSYRVRSSMVSHTSAMKEAATSSEPWNCGCA